MVCITVAVGWATINVLLSLQASEKIGLGLRLQNLGDRSYRKHGLGIDTAGRNIGIWIGSVF